MAVWNRKTASSSVGSSPRVQDSEIGKADYHADARRYDEPLDVVTETDKVHSLHRGLKSRQITMIAIGGAIGTGLIIGTGKALATAGPASILISYSIVGFLVWLVMCALGEMAAWLPLGSGFAGYASRFCDPCLGFALGYTYWMKYIIVTPNQLTAAALVIQYWCPPEKVNPGVFITVFLVTIIAINYFGVSFFGEFEFWLSSIKVCVICGVIILSLILALGGGPDGDRRGFRYWSDPGAFNPYILEGSAGNFLAVWSSMITAVFAYLGTELVGVTVGEAQNPRKTIPRAIRLTFYRILIFYIVSVFLLGMIVPFDSKKLATATEETTGSSASPFVVAIILSGIESLPGIFNACILIFVFSAANSDLYIASRTLYGLAAQGKAPRVFARTDRRGVPVISLGTCAAFCLLAYMNVSENTQEVFGYFTNLVTIFGLLTWISILTTHIWFVRARKVQQIPDSAMPFTAPLGIWGSIGALFFCCLIALTKNFTVFIHDEEYGDFDYENFITGYLGIPVYLALIFGYKFFKKSRGVSPSTADFYTGKDVIDRMEAEFLAQQAETKKQTRGGWFYRHFVAWLF